MIILSFSLEGNGDSQRVQRKSKNQHYTHPFLPSREGDTSRFNLISRCQYQTFPLREMPTGKGCSARVNTQYYTHPFLPSREGDTSRFNLISRCQYQTFPFLHPTSATRGMHMPIGKGCSARVNTHN
jgi:hypothetical protein